MNDRENADENEDDDVLCSLLSRHSYDVDCKTFSGAGDVASVKEQIDDDTETQNSQPTNMTVNTRRSEKRYKCDVCHMTFSRLIRLNRHKRNHKRSHVGDICTTSTDLTEHKLVHSRARPYTCYLCDVGFAQLGHLKGTLRRRLTYIFFSFNKKFNI